MSHTFKAPGGTSFLHNSDLSGDVTVVTPTGEINVPGDDLLAFVAEWVRNQRIGALENMEDAEIFGIPDWR